MKKIPIFLISIQLFLLSSTLYSQQKIQEKPNFLFIISDDHSYNAVHALGNNEIHTPNLDKLVEQGVNFTHCFNQGSWSGAVCVASRTMLITGQTVFKAPQNKSYLNKWAQGKDSLETEVKLWGEAFAEAGYKTFMTGKWHNTNHAVLKGFDNAKGIGAGMYETFDASNSKKFAYERPKETIWTPWNKEYKGHWSPRVRDIILDENGIKKIGANYVVTQHTSDFYTDNIVDFLLDDARNSDNPFFAFVSFNAPHDPRQSPKEFIDMYPLDNISIPENYLPEHPFDQGDHKIRDEMLAPFPRTRNAIKLHKQEYYAIITHLDQELGRIFHALEKSGKADNTYIIFTSDHGLAVGSHGLMGKQNQYDHSIRMPFIIKGPNLKAGKKVNSMIYMQSVYATTCDLAGIPIPDSVDFPSIVNLITEENSKGQKYVFGAYKNLQRMIRSDKFKLIVYPKVNEVQLFDLENDPNEITNLANDLNFSNIKNRLFRALKKEQKKLGDFLVLD